MSLKLLYRANSTYFHLASHPFWISASQDTDRYPGHHFSHNARYTVLRLPPLQMKRTRMRKVTHRTPRR